MRVRFLVYMLTGIVTASMSALHDDSPFALSGVCPPDRPTALLRSRSPAQSEKAAARADKHRIAAPFVRCHCENKKVKTNLGEKTAHYPKPVSTMQRKPHESSTQKISPYGVRKHPDLERLRQPRYLAQVFMPNTRKD